MTIVNIPAAALSLLLVFRTNASYDRWWEARKLWGLLLNRSRDIVRQSLTYFAPQQTRLKNQFVRYVTAFNYALKVHLRANMNLDEDYRKDLTPILKPDELEAALGDPHPPLHILFMMSQIVQRADLRPIQGARIDENLTTFSDILGACERIIRCPIPLPYTRHTSRFLFLWLMAIPFAIVGDCGWLTIPVTAFVATALLGVEDLGVQIEEPFSVLALESICDLAANNNRSMYAQQDRAHLLCENNDQPTRHAHQGVRLKRLTHSY